MPRWSKSKRTPERVAILLRVAPLLIELMCETLDAGERFSREVGMEKIWNQLDFTDLYACLRSSNSSVLHKVAENSPWIQSTLVFLHLGVDTFQL